MNTSELKNPVSATAWSPAFLRTGVGIPYADEIAELISAKEKIADLMGGEENAMIAKKYFGCWAELRHRSLSAAIENRLCVLELSAGFSPRCFSLTERPEVRYFSTDLSDMHIERLRVFGKLFTDRRPAAQNGTHYCKAVDATSTISVADCYWWIGEPESFVVINEGLLSYLTHEQKFQVAMNIRALLILTGGSWWTPDIHTTEEMQRTESLSAAYLPNFESKAGSRFTDKTFESLDEAEALMHRAGFRVVRHRQLDFVPISNLRATVPEESKAILEDAHLWEMIPV